MTFTWHPDKAIANLKKHSVDFREAATIFDDDFSVAFSDGDHSVGERRFLIIGMSVLNRLLVVSYIEINAQTIRIISARPATPRERTFYEEDETSPR